MDTRDVGLRIRRLRVLQQLDQADFAYRVGIATGSVSKLENGLMPLSDGLAENLSRVLDCTRHFLLAEVDVPTPTRPWLRAYADASSKVVDRQVYDCAIAYEASAHLGLRRLSDTIPTFGGDLNDDYEIENFAQDVRAVAGIADGQPVGNSIRAAERLGCVVLPMASELGRHLGLSVRMGQVATICVSRPSLAPYSQASGDRQRFTVSHELGHLALHAALGPPQSAAEAAMVEKQAHRFAGAFLAPGDAMLDELSGFNGRVTLTTLSRIKARWGVAIKALVMRFRHLDVIDDDAARSLYKQISARGWNTAEPVPVGNEKAVWMTKALEAWSGQPADRAVQAAAGGAGIGVSYWRRWTDWSPTFGLPSAEVFKLDVHRARRKSSLERK